LILSNKGKSVSQLAEFFEVSRITIYSWFEAWDKNGIVGLMNRKGQGRKSILSLQNPAHIKSVKAAIKKNPQSVKCVVAELESKIGAPMHPETLKRFLKNLVTASVASEPVSSQGRWVLNEKKKKRR
jgi:transposase